MSINRFNICAIVFSILCVGYCCCVPVRARTRIDVAATMPVTVTATVAPVVTGIDASRVTNSAASQTARVEVADQHGDSGEWWNIPVTLSGSGWPLVAVAALACVVAWLYRAKGRNGDRAIAGIGAAVQDMGAGPQRTKLLASIEEKLDAKPSPTRDHADGVLKDAGVYVKK